MFDNDTLDTQIEAAFSRATRRMINDIMRNVDSKPLSRDLEQRFERRAKSRPNLVHITFCAGDLCATGPMEVLS